MLELVEQLVSRGVEPLLLTFGVVLARVVPIVELAPFLGGRATPRTVKTAVAFAITLVIFPSMLGPLLDAYPLSGPAIVALLLRESLIGLTLGFVVALVFEAVRMAGQVIDAARGQTLANALVPQLPERASVTADYLYQLSVVLFLVVGGHRLFLRSLVQTYQTSPPMGELGGPEVLEASVLHVVRLTADAISLGLSLAIPALFAVLLADLLLALVNKAAPQINVFFLGMPLKALLGSAVVMLGLGLFADVLVDRALATVDDVEVVARTLGGADVR